MILELMKARRSIRAFKPEPPPRELIERLVEAAATAPSASNKQPWRFWLVTNADKRAELVRVVREAVERLASHVPQESEASFRAYGDFFTRFESAPVLIVPLFRGPSLLSNLMDSSLPEAERAELEQLERDSGLIGASLALQNLLLMATEVGLGASAMTGPLVAGVRLHQALDIPLGWGIVALVPVGFPAEVPKATTRKPVSSILRWIP
jgi:nitroreductase